MMAPIPKVLVIGQIYWAQEECKSRLGPVAEVLHMDSNSRSELFAEFRQGGKYGDIVGIYHESLSTYPSIGHPDEAFFEALPASCKWLAHKGAGYDSIDVNAAKKRGVGVSNTPDGVREATATTAVYLLISTIRRFSWCEAEGRNGGFSPLPKIEAQAHDLSGRKVGILGLGGIGRTIINYIRPFGMKTYYHNRSPSDLAPPDITYCADLNDLLETVDALIVAIPLNGKTRGMIGEQQIHRMKKGSILINIARGPVIDEEAMITALESGHLGAAGLDVFSSEPKIDERLFKLPQVTVLPHVGTENQDARKKMELIALDNLREYIMKGKGPDLVPELR